MATTQQTSTAGAGIGAVIGGMYGNPQAGASAGGQIGSMFGNDPDGYNTYRSHMRKFTADQYAAARKHDRRRFRALRQGAEWAGLHPLAALGISPSSAPSAAPMVPPGQTRTGSVVKDIIAEAEQRSFQLERQQLENDLIREQIAASRHARKGQESNYIQDQDPSVPGIQIKHKDLLRLKDRHPEDFMVSVAPPPEHTGTDSGLSLYGLLNLEQRPGSLTAQGAEDALGEPWNWVYNLFNLPATAGYNIDKQIERWATKKYGSKKKAKASRYRSIDPYSP